MTEESESSLPVRTRVVPRLKVTRRSNSRVTFAAFTVLLLFIGIIRNYAVEGQLAARVRKMRTDYSWAAQYTRYLERKMGKDAPDPEYPGKFRFPWTPFRFLSWRFRAEDEEEEDEKLLKELANANVTSVDATQSNEGLRGEEVRLNNRTVSSVTSDGRSDLTNEGPSPNQITSIGSTSIKEEHAGKFDTPQNSHPVDKVPLEASRTSGKIHKPSQTADESGSPNAMHDFSSEGFDGSDGQPPVPFDSPDSPDSISSSITKGAGQTAANNHVHNEQLPKAAPVYRMAMNLPAFKFEAATPESLSQWQDKRSIVDRTARSLRRLQEVLIDEYVAWHAKMIQDLKSGSKDPREVRVLLFAGQEGVGERLRGMVYAFFCAVLSERLLLIDSRWNYPLTAALELGVGTNFAFDASLFGELSDSEYRTVSFRSYPHLNDVKTLLGSDKLLKVTKGTQPDINFLLKDVPTYLPSLPAVQKLGTLERTPWATEFFPLIFKALFRTTPQLRSRVVRFTENGNDYTKSFIGIHARLGHDTLEGRLRRFRSDLSMADTAHCLAQTAIEMAKMRGLDPPRFFLASDTAEFRSTLRAALQEIEPQSELMTGDWEIRHNKDISKSTPGDDDVFFGLFTDLLILSHADSLLHMKASFSTVARWMGGIEPHYGFSKTSCIIK